MNDAHIANVLQRDFCATAPNQKWATDITEFNLSGHKLYLSACMDLYSGEIVAYRMARRPIFEMVSRMLEAALLRTSCDDRLNSPTTRCSPTERCSRDAEPSKA